MKGENSMAIEQILLPGLGESVHEASIINWLVKPGDHVKKYDPLAETVSDKVTTEIPSNFAGVIKAYLVDLDKEVPIGTPIMSIEVEGAASAPEPAAATSSPAAQPASPPAPVPIPAAPSKPSAAGGKRFSPAVLALAEEKASILMMSSAPVTMAESPARMCSITRLAPARQPQCLSLQLRLKQPPKRQPHRPHQQYRKHQSQHLKRSTLNLEFMIKLSRLMVFVKQLLVTWCKVPPKFRMLGC